MSGNELKWALIGAVVLYLVQRFTGILAVQRKSSSS